MTDLVDDLARAIASDELFLVYQPKLSVVTRRWSGVEALLRWNHPERGMVPPNLFIPVAEASGLIRSLTERVLAMAIERWRAWRQSGLWVPIAINISAKDIEAGFPDLFERVCQEHDATASAITFELTESATCELVDLLDVATRLRLKGTRLSIDDFGTGYSSVVQLHRLPFSELKIDRLFVSELAHSQEARTIVRAIVDLAHALDLTVVAEGVETEAEFKYLGEIGCDEAQGYYFSRPVMAALLPEVWRARAGVTDVASPPLVSAAHG